MLQFAPMKFELGGSTCSSQICSHQNFLYWGGVLFWSTHIHTPYRLDKQRSALAEARLKIRKKLPDILNQRLCI